MVDGVSGGGEITIRHLLGHASGLADHAFDAPFLEEVLADPGLLRLDNGAQGLDPGLHCQLAIPAPPLMLSRRRSFQFL